MKALLVIDVQKGYIESYGEELLSRINERLKKVEKDGELIVYVKNVRKLKGEKAVNEFADGLLVLSDKIVYKERASIFTDADFAALLRNSGVTELELIGIDGCCCVASSALDARLLGFSAVMPQGYIGVKNAARFEKKRAALIKAGVVVTE